VSSTLIDICDAVVEEINANAATWSQSFRAIRMNVPQVKREEIENLHVIVSPKSIKKTRVTRAAIQKSLDVYVYIQKGLKGSTNNESDSLIAFGEEVSDYFSNGRSLSIYAGAPCVAAEFGDSTPFFDKTAANDAQAYAGVVFLSFEVLESV